MGKTNGNGIGMGIKTRLNLGEETGMGMSHWEWEGMGLKSHSRSSLLQSEQKIGVMDSTTLQDTCYSESRGLCVKTTDQNFEKLLSDWENIRVL